MGYRDPYADREKLFQNTPEDNPVNQREAKKRLDGLFSEPKKAEINRCTDGHNWVSHTDGPVRCSKCKILKPRG